MRMLVLALITMALTGCPSSHQSETQAPSERAAASADASSPSPQPDASTPQDSGPPPVLDGSTQGGDAETRAKAQPRPLDVAPQLAKSINAFGVDMYSKMRAAPGNTALSPMSITLALAMTYGGAKGVTASQMAKVLHHPGAPELLHGQAAKLLTSVSSEEPRPNEIRIANRLFGEKSYTFEQPFLTLTKEQYGAELERVDFGKAFEQARGRINSWVAGETENRIPEILPVGSLSADTRLALVNALYFKGRWALPFEKRLTRDAPFYLAAEKTQVPTMHKTDRFGFRAQDGVKILQMTYVGDHLAMTIILPDERDGLTGLESSLTAVQLAGWLTNLPRKRVVVALPRFTLETEAPIRLNSHLESLGMSAPFSRAQADFTAMANPPDPEERLFIQHVFHRTFVEVTEEGTEAAAATAVVMNTLGSAAPMQASTFVADHPFLFVIHTREPEAILFVGRVIDPR